MDSVDAEPPGSSVAAKLVRTQTQKGFPDGEPPGSSVAAKFVRTQTQNGFPDGEPSGASATVAGSATVPGSTSEDSDSVIQYIIVRRDLIETFPLGSIVSQSCQASIAAIEAFKDDPYSSNLLGIYKVTVEVKDEIQMTDLQKKQNSMDISHKVWTEQHEKMDIPACMATKPYPSSILVPIFKDLQKLVQLPPVASSSKKVMKGFYAHEPDSFIQEYEEVVLIGDGGSGKVFSCVNRIHKQKRAVKVMRLLSGSENPFLEVEILSKLSSINHPNIVFHYHSWLLRDYPEGVVTEDKSYESYESEGGLFQSYSEGNFQSPDEYVSVFSYNKEDEEDEEEEEEDGEAGNHSLDVVEDKEEDDEEGDEYTILVAMKLYPQCLKDLILSPFSKDRIKMIFEGVLSALVFIHRISIVHGDIKAANIFLDADGTAVLGDFGHAFYAQQYEDRTHHSMIGFRGARVEDADLEPLSASKDVFDFALLMLQVICTFPQNWDMSKEVKRLREVTDCDTAKQLVELGGAMGGAVLMILREQSPQNRLTADSIARMIGAEWILGKAEVLVNKNS